MIVRRVLCCVVLLAAAFGLTACQTKVGLAASVGNRQLTESQLSGYVKPGAGPITSAGSNGQAQTIYPRQTAVEVWLQTASFDQAVRQHGGARTNVETSAARAAALGSSSLSAERKLVGRSGFTPKFADLYVDRAAAAVVLIERLAKVSAPQALSMLNSGQAGSALLAAARRVHVPVAVSPRYGTWDANNLALSQSPGSGAPSFVQFGATQ